jgi:zinc protease
MSRLSIRAFLRAVPLLVGLLSPGLLSPAAVVAQAGFKAPRVPLERYTLPNGLTVLLSRDTTVRVVAVDVWYHVGSKNELPGRTGFAHLFEHVMFQGSKHVPNGAHIKTVEESGGEMNGSTANDRTNYYETMPSNQLETALWLESDRMGFLLDSLTRGKLDAQRGVVQNERRQSVDNQPFGAAEEIVSAAMFPASNPYSWPVIGSMADLRAATLDDVKHFFHTYYAPGNATLAVVGDFDPARTRTLIAKYFGPIPAGPKVLRPRVAPVALAGEKRLALEDPKGTVPQLLIAWPSAGLDDPSRRALDVLGQVLARDRTSRLTRLLVYDRQLASEVSAGNQAYENGGIFRIEVTPRPGVALTEIERLIDSTLAALAKTGPTAAEVDRYKNARKLWSVVELDGALSRAELLLDGEVYHGDPLYYLKDIERALAVSPVGVAQVQRRYLTKGRVVMSMVPGGQLAAAADTSKPYTRLAPPAETATADSAAPPATDAVPGPTPAAAGRPTPETFARTRPPVGEPRPLAFPAIQMRTLSNGIAVAIIESHKVPAVSVTAVLDIPSSADPAGKTGLGGIVANMLGEGTSTRTADQVADAAAALGGLVDATGFFTITSNIDSAFALMADQLRHPAFPEAALERVRANQIAELREAKANPGYLTRRVFSSVVYGAAHPYARSMTEREVGSIVGDDVRRFYQRYYRPPNVKFVVAGDLTPDQAVAALERYFGDWSAGEQARVVPPEPKPVAATTIYLYDRPGSPQSVIALGAIGPRRDTPDYYAIELMNTAFGGAFTSRLNLNLRERRHFTYGAFSGFQFRRPPETSVFQAQAAVETPKTDSSLVEMMRELTDLHGSRPVTPAELEFARDGVVKGLPLRFDGLLSLAGAAETIVRDSLPLDYYAALIPNYQRVTVAEAGEAGRKYLDPAHLAIVVVGDRSQVEAKLRALNLAPVVIVTPLPEEDAAGTTRQGTTRR